MTILAACLFLALTRAEIIERFKAPPITQVSGLVQVSADCPREIRRAYQAPIAGFAGALCRELYQGVRLAPKTFERPGIVVFLGDEKGTNTAVLAQFKEKNGEKRCRIYLPAPEFSDLSELRKAVIRGFYYVVMNEKVTADEGLKRYHRMDPQRRAEEDYAVLAAWRKGEKVSESDEACLKLSRSVLQPGLARPEDVLQFAARLTLYPPYHGYPFLGRYAYLSFEEAIDLAKEAPLIRFVAYRNAPLMIVYAGGRTPELAAAGQAYSDFLFELARYQLSADELKKRLQKANDLLKKAYEKAEEDVKGIKP